MAVVSIKNKLRRGNLLVGNDPFIPSNFESIASATGTGSSGTITFSSIPQTYQHLQIRMMCQVDSGTSGITTSFLRFNEDSGTNYVRHLIDGDGTTVLAAAGTSATSIQVCRTTRNLDTALGVSVTDIHDYASASKNKTVRVFHGADLNGSGSVRLESGLWINTAPVTSISIINTTANFKSTSTFALYGIKS